MHDNISERNVAAVFAAYSEDPLSSRSNAILTGKLIFPDSLNRTHVHLEGVYYVLGLARVVDSSLRAADRPPYGILVLPV
jgi:hypothetical protein